MLKSAFISGFIGDAGLQFIVKNSKDKNKFGLKTYFEQHGSVESLFIAGGLMYGCFAFYKLIDPKFDVYGLSIYAAILDIIFRFTHIFPSLDNYYKIEPPIMTIPWAIIPALITFQLNSYIKS